jgi:DNA-binding NarL/FixJ family response regulator
MPVSIVVALRSRMKCELMCRALKAHSRQFAPLAWALTAEELLKKVAELRPEVTVISSHLQGDAKAGLKALRELRASAVITNAILLVDCSESELVVNAFSAGAKGVICVNDPFEVLCKCIERVRTGQIWANSQELQWVLKTLAAREPVHVVDALGNPLLTQREGQIVGMVAEGMPSREIAAKLEVSPHTVKNHLFRIYEKLGVSNRSELVLYALTNRQSKASQ